MFAWAWTGRHSQSLYQPSTRVVLQEHDDELNINAFGDDEHGGKRRIMISPKTDVAPGMQ